MHEPHPTYPNPTIQEALCEVHFQLPEGASWRPSIFGEFFKAVQEEFPDFEPVTQVTLQLQLGDGRLEQGILPPQQRIRYKHKGRPLLLQLYPNVLVVNTLRPYPGWAQMRADITSAWGRLQGVVQSACVSRIGLRYINRIPRHHQGQPAGEWLAASEYLPKSVLSSQSGFALRLQTRPTAEDRLNVALAEVAEEPGATATDILFDIDCVVEKNLGPDERDVAKGVNLLHERVWRVFDSSSTPALVNLLTGGAK